MSSDLLSCPYSVDGYHQYSEVEYAPSYWCSLCGSIMRGGATFTPGITIKEQNDAKHFHERRTRFQRHSNYMLGMRRMFGEIELLLRFQNTNASITGEEEVRMLKAHDDVQHVVLSLRELTIILLDRIPKDA